MNDRELERLIGMAFEAEALERSGQSEPTLRLAGHAGLAVGVRRWARGVGIATAAAASLAAAFVVMHQRISIRQTPPAIAHNDARPAPHGLPGPTGAEPKIRTVSESRPSTLMAVFRNADGQCACMQVKPHHWGEGRQLAEVDRRELVDAAMSEACSVNPHQVLVVAVESKGEAVTLSREEAEAIAEKLGEAPGGRHGDLSSYAYAAIPGLPRDATVVAERVSVRQSASALDHFKGLAQELNLPGF